MMSQSPKAASARRRPVIIMTGGGSGGHITPILSLAHELKRLRPDSYLVYIGLKGESIRELDERLKIFDEICRIPAGKLRRYHGRWRWLQSLNPKTIILNLIDSIKLLRGYGQARRILHRLQPDVVFSKGGYVALPVGMAARSAGVPIVTHDSDSVPGLTNRLVGRWARLKTNGFPGSDGSQFVGIPLDPRIKLVTPELQRQYKQQLGLAQDSLVLLVGGAGLGSKDLNDLIALSARQLLKDYPELVIIQLTGKLHLNDVEQTYRRDLTADERDRLIVRAFVDDFYVYSGAADLIVTRAGATSIAEFAAQAKACIVIPADWLPGAQQVNNAQLLAKSEAAVVINNQIDREEFQELISQLLKDESKRQALASGIHKLAKTDAAQKLAKILLDIAEAKK